MRIKAIGSWFLAVMVAVQPCWGWGEVGHHVVGRVAAALLAAAAQQKVAQILDVDNTKSAVADAMADAAEWPDAVARTEFPQSQIWHFIDLGAKANPALDNPLWASPDTAFAKIVRYFKTVRNGGPDELEPGSDLKFLVHLLGDIHQPLHVATDQDRGGNCLFIKFVKDEGRTSARTKFHSAWDTSMLEDRLGADDKAITRHLVRDWKNLSAAQKADILSAMVPGDEISATARAWVIEGHGLAVSKLYGTLMPTVPAFETAEVAPDCHDAAPLFKSKTWSLNDSAADDAGALMEQQLMKAGARLAALLNAAAAQ